MDRFRGVSLRILVLGALVVFRASAGEHGGHKAEGEAHGHAAPHGGVVKTIGDHHVELVFKATEGVLHLYVLGTNEKTATTIDAKELTAQARVHEGDFRAVTLKCDPLEGEKEGACSHFSGADASLKGAKALEVVVQVPIGGTRHRASFKLGEAGHHGAGDKGEHKKGGHHE